MKFLLASLLLASLSDVALSQPGGRCECGLFIIQRIGFPVPHGPIHSFESYDVSCDDPSADANCQLSCSASVEEALNMDWDEEKPGDGVSYGQYWCTTSYEFLDWDNPENVVDIQCLTTYSEGRYRLDQCIGPDWQTAYAEGRDFCCDQLGDYISGCPAEGIPPKTPVH